MGYNSPTGRIIGYSMKPEDLWVQTSRFRDDKKMQWRYHLRYLHYVNHSKLSNLASPQVYSWLPARLSILAAETFINFCVLYSHVLLRIYMQPKYPLVIWHSNRKNCQFIDDLSWFTYLWETVIFQFAGSVQFLDYIISSTLW